MGMPAIKVKEILEGQEGVTCTVCYSAVVSRAEVLLPMRRLTVCVLVYALLPSQCFATRLIFLITPSGITVGMDSRNLRQESAEGRPTIWIESITEKSALIQNRIVIGSIGLKRIGLPGIPAIYEFGPWIERVKSRIPPHVSVDAFSRIVEDESRNTVTSINKLGSSTLANIQPVGVTLLDYEIFGYENSIPMAYAVYMNFDRERKIVLSPVRRQNHPEQGVRVDFRMGFPPTTTLCGADKVSDIQSRAHQQAFAKFPDEIAAISAQQDISLPKAAQFIAFLLSLEAECDQKDVAPPYVIYTIPKVGRAKRELYDGTSPIPILPKSGKTKPTQKHQ